MWVFSEFPIVVLKKLNNAIYDWNFHNISLCRGIVLENVFKRKKYNVSASATVQYLYPVNIIFYYESYEITDFDQYPNVKNIRS